MGCIAPYPLTGFFGTSLSKQILLIADGLTRHLANSPEKHKILSKEELGEFVFKYTHVLCVSGSFDTRWMDGHSPQARMMMG